MPLKISISWAAGAGKSTIIQNIVKKLWYQTYDIGQVFRARAVKKWMTIADYDKLVEKNPQEDVEIDNDFKKKILSSKKDVIASRRMWFHCLPEIFSIRLDVSPKEWARRILHQDRGQQEKKYANINEVMKANEDRMKRLQKRLLKIYGVDFMNKKNYKRIIKTDWKTIEEMTKEVLQTIKAHQRNPY